MLTISLLCVCTVATSSTRALVDLKTSQKHEDLFSLFTHVVTGCHTEVELGKPDPDIYHVARAQFQGQPFFYWYGII